LKVAVSSPPADGQANTALLEFLAERLAIPKSCVRLLSGAGSREKRVAIDEVIANMRQKADVKLNIAAPAAPGAPGASGGPAPAVGGRTDRQHDL
jgi:hypothetical protein